MATPTKISKKKEISNKHNEIVQAVQLVADINFQWGMSKKAMKFVYQNQEYTPSSVEQRIKHVDELLADYAALLSPDRTNSVTTKTKIIVQELINFVKDPKTNFGIITVDGKTRPARDMLLSLFTGRSCHRVVNTLLMRYISINGLNKNDPKPAGMKAPNVRSTTDDSLNKYLAKYINLAGKDKGFSVESGFATFNSGTIATKLFVNDEEFKPSPEEVEVYRKRLDDIKGDADTYPLSAYVDALASLVSPSQALVDYANVLNDVAVLDLAKSAQEEAKAAAKVPAVGGRGRARKTVISSPDKVVATDVLAEVVTTPVVVATPVVVVAAPVVDVVANEPPQETQDSLKQVAATPMKTTAPKTTAPKAMTPKATAPKVSTPKVPAASKTTKK